MEQVTPSAKLHICALLLQQTWTFVETDLVAGLPADLIERRDYIQRLYRRMADDEKSFVDLAFNKIHDMGATPATFAAANRMPA